MTDYSLSKLFYDLHNDPKLAAEYRGGMQPVLARYDLAPEMLKAVQSDDVAAVAPHVNAYLLRFYFQVRGMPQDEFMARLSAIDAQKSPAQKVAANG